MYTVSQNEHLLRDLIQPNHYRLNSYYVGDHSVVVIVVRN